MQAIVEQMCDGMFKNVGPDTELIINWGSLAGRSAADGPPPEWLAPTDGHLDGYGGNRWGGGYLLMAICYINDVVPDGGGLCYWPRSHHSVHRFFRQVRKTPGWPRSRANFSLF